MLSFEPRRVCGRCRRPESVCYCAHLTSIETTTRVVILQHPRERDVAIGTARMASLCLPNAELHVGVSWEQSPPLSRALDDRARPAILLYPGEEAIDVVTSPPAGPVTLIVVDGTWSQAKTLVRDNPRLRALPRYTFNPPAPSEYRIRKEPNAAYVSTLEALVHVLGALEGDPARFTALLAPFRAMIAAQIDCERRLQGARLRHAKKGPPTGPRVPALFRERAADLVCVVGEANAWPYQSRERESLYVDELVHWVAHRPATGESFDFVVAPRNAMAPRTPAHVGLSAEQLLGGGSLDELLGRWRSFARPSDVVCHWGHYAAALFARSGGYLPGALVDVRQVARTLAGGKVGTLEEFVARVGVAPRADLAIGRGGARVAKLGAVVARFAELT